VVVTVVIEMRFCLPVAIRAKFGEVKVASENRA
jgi:hypothetical protein